MPQATRQVKPRLLSRASLGLSAHARESLEFQVQSPDRTRHSKRAQHLAAHACNHFRSHIAYKGACPSGAICITRETPVETVAIRGGGVPRTLTHSMSVYISILFIIAYIIVLCWRSLIKLTVINYIIVQLIFIYAYTEVKFVLCYLIPWLFG